MVETIEETIKKRRLNHKEGITFWVEELRKNNPTKKYCILNKPQPDAIEFDLETGKITALEFENSSYTVFKEKIYEKNLSDFDEVFIKCRCSQIKIFLKRI